LVTVNCFQLSQLFLEYTIVTVYYPECRVLISDATRIDEVEIHLILHVADRWPLPISALYSITVKQIILLIGMTTER
jgi:hypothetical protein